MNFLKRAFLSVTARKGKSMLLVFVFSVICVLVLAGLSIQTAAQKSSELARQQLGGEVTLQVDREKLMAEGGQQQSEGRQQGRMQSVPVPVESATALLSLDNIKGYNYYSSASGLAEDFEPIVSETIDEEETNTGQGGFNNPGNMRGVQADISVQGVLFTDSVETFLNDEASIVEGRHLTEEDIGEDVAVIEQNLAIANDLAIGDRLTIQRTDETSSVMLEIVGIYETTELVDDQAASFDFLNPYNRVYTPYTTASSLKSEDYEDAIDYAVYFMDDPANIQSFIDEASLESTIDFDVFKLDANDQLYEQMIGPIENVASFSTNVVYLVTIAGAIILGLIVMMSIRERKYEMGVLLAIGEKKWKLMGQFLVEILVVAVIALGISAVSGNVVAGQIGDQLLSQEIQQSEETASNPASFGQRMPRQVQQQIDVEPVNELQIDVTAGDLSMLGMIGLLIAILSTLIPSMSILSLQPKTILSRQD
ncbi:ABC transporter permease [Cytobacillus sp. IB215316]|uniref:ABC transporter permease n=1 Tax=Cytobacillus sp. IB215316 TaxID=3097354 RepID=UPI002A13AE50|nr:ABC transporter permease [Cytobacillus sp. IB215316]MDX8362074.1 ABC transporter permease [Cytobacillus sp. IB215316]